MKTDYVDLWRLHDPPAEQVESGDLLRGRGSSCVAGSHEVSRGVALAPRM